MKILLLSPIDEQHVVSTLSLTSGMEENVLKDTFEMAGYADFLVQTKKAKNWEEAILKTFITLDQVLKQKTQNVLIIGNAPKKYNFDIIMSYDDGIQIENYKDPFLELIQEKTSSDNDLFYYISNLYQKEDSQLILENKNATKNLLTKLIKIKHREKELDNVIKQYENWIKKHTFR